MLTRTPREVDRGKSWDVFRSVWVINCCDVVGKLELGGLTDVLSSPMVLLSRGIAGLLITQTVQASSVTVCVA